MFIYRLNIEYSTRENLNKTGFLGFKDVMNFVMLKNVDQSN